MLARSSSGRPTLKSTWTGGLGWWQYQDLAVLVHAAGADVVSANWQVHEPDQRTMTKQEHDALVAIPESGWYQLEDPSIYHGPDVAGLHQAGMRVVPYTVDDEATMQRVIELGVDGIIRDYPDVLITVAKRSGLR